MGEKAVRQGVAIVLALSQFGCQSVYRFRCTSNPTEAGVVVGEQMLGETECVVEIAADSELIQDGRIEFRFCLPDGREETREIDLRDLEPTNPVAEIVAAPFLVAGIGLLWLGQDGDDDDSNFSDEDDGDDERATLLGLGSIGIGAGAYVLLGGDFKSYEPCKVHVDFNEPAEKR